MQQQHKEVVYNNTDFRDPVSFKFVVCKIVHIYRFVQIFPSTD